MDELESLFCPDRHAAANIVGVDDWLSFIGANGTYVAFEHFSVTGRMHARAFMLEPDLRAIIDAYDLTMLDLGPIVDSGA